MKALCQTDEVQGVEGALAALLEWNAGVEEPVGHVVQYGGVFGQEELLEDEPDPGGPQIGHVLVGHCGDVEPGNPYLTGSGSIEGSHQLQQSGLARSRRADDPDQLALADGEVDSAQSLNGRLTRVAFGHVLDVEHRRSDIDGNESIVASGRVGTG